MPDTSDMNTVILTGEVADSPRVNNVGSTQKAQVRLMCVRHFRKNDGTQGESRSYITVDMWGDLAAQAAGLREGDRVSILGQLEYQSWTDSSGSARASMVVRASRAFRVSPMAGAADNPPAAPSDGFAGFDEVPF